jgi:hypothetical protein
MVIEARGPGRRKAGGGRWQRWIDGRWVNEEESDVRFEMVLPSNPPSEVRRRFEPPSSIEAEEVPAMPDAGRSPVKRRDPTPREIEAWRLCGWPPEGQGMYWADAARLMHVSSSQVVQGFVVGYMTAMDIEGEPPGRMPPDERQRRARAAGAARRVTTSSPEAAQAVAGDVQDAIATASEPDEGAAAGLPMGSSSTPEPGPEPRPSGPGGGLIGEEVLEAGGTPSTSSPTTARDAIAAELALLDVRIERMVADVDRLTAQTVRLRHARDRLADAHQALVEMDALP